MDVQIFPAGAGTATLSVSGHGGHSTDVEVLDYTLYEFRASPGDGWRFDHFEWDWERRYTHMVSEGGEEREVTEVTRGTETGVDNPYNETDYGTTRLCDYLLYATHIVNRIEHRIVVCRAYFSKKKTNVTVCAVVRLVASGQVDRLKAACTATVDGVKADEEGVSKKTKEGYAGESETFSLSAKSGKGWKFWKWVDLTDGENVSFDADATLTTKHDPDGIDTYMSVAAKFVKDTGKILYDPSSGKVLCGSGGGILYEG